MKIVKELIKDEPLMEKYMNDNVKEVNNITSISEITDYLFKITNGHHFPINPINPLRSAIREKLLELSKNNIKVADKSYLSSLIETLSGDWKPINLHSGTIH